MKDESTLIACNLGNLPEDETTWERFDAMTDEDIDYSDDPPTDDTFWEDAEVVIPESQQLISLYVETDVIEWFSKVSDDYPAAINAVLRDYVSAFIPIGTGR